MRRKTAAERKRQGSVVDTLNRRGSDMLRALLTEEQAETSLLVMLRNRLNENIETERAETTRHVDRRSTTLGDAQ
jgi:hypothetical protein